MYEQLLTLRGGIPLHTQPLVSGEITEECTSFQTYGWKDSRTLTLRITESSRTAGFSVTIVCITELWLNAATVNVGAKEQSRLYVTEVSSKLLTMKILKYLPEWTNCHVTFRNVVAHGKWVRSVDATVEMEQEVTWIKKHKCDCALMVNSTCYNNKSTHTLDV